MGKIRGVDDGFRPGAERPFVGNASAYRTCKEVPVPPSFVMRSIAARNRLLARRSRERMRRVRAAVEARRLRLREEIASSITHGAGLVLAVAAAPVLVVLGGLRGGTVHVASFSIYGSSLVLCYAASTLYHAFQRPRLKHVFHILDHAAIYFLIAGTYTPIVLLSMNDPWGWTLLGGVWALALIGCVFKIFFVGRFHYLSTAIYVVMGWLVVLALEPFLASVPPAVFGWLLAGGVSYTAGVAFFVWERLPYNHAVWHLFVIGGSACHYAAMLIYVW